MQVYAATVVLLTDCQLRELGLSSMGEIATVRAACRAKTKGTGICAYLWCMCVCTVVYNHGN